MGKPPLFDGNVTDMSLFPVSEDESILLRHMDDVVDTSPDKCHRHRAIGEMANPRNQHIEMPQIQYTDKVADESVAVQRQVSPRTTETKAPEHQWVDRSSGDADEDVQGEAIDKYCWSEGKNTVNIYLELDGLDDGKRRLGTSCSTMLQRRRQSRTTPRTATRIPHSVSTKRH